MTFSIVARCADSGQFGVAISSSSPAVAARCAFARAGVGAVASQNVTDPRLGPRALDLLERGASASEAASILARGAHEPDYRQLLVVDRTGEAAVHSGPRSLGVFTTATDRNCASGGNLLDNDGVPAAIVAAFATSSGPFAQRLLDSLRAGRDAGGEAGPVHSAGLLVVDGVPWPIVDLRCDWTLECPIDVLSTVWSVYAPQVGDYVQRALDPSAAPSYGVPGNE